MGVRIALLALALVLAAAAPASARTLERKSLNGEQQLVFTSDFSAVGENLVVAGVTGTLQLDFNNSADAFSGPAPSGCAPLSIHLLRCDRQVTQRMTVFLGERDDVWRSFVTIPTTVHGNVGDDWLDSRSAPDTLLGEAGHDLIADDPDVADSDTMTGGAGDDVIVNGLGADDIRGGEGIDSVSLGSTNDLVTLDDVANDGGASGEGDNIRSDVENLDGGGGNDRLAGDGDANRLEGGPGADELFGGGGADDLIGGAGADVLFGGRTLIARHTLRPRAWRCRSALTSASPSTTSRTMEPWAKATTCEAISRTWPPERATTSCWATRSPTRSTVAPATMM